MRKGRRSTRSGRVFPLSLGRQIEEGPARLRPKLAQERSAGGTAIGPDAATKIIPIDILDGLHSPTLPRGIRTSHLGVLTSRSLVNTDVELYALSDLKRSLNPRLPHSESARGNPFQENLVRFVYTRVPVVGAFVQVSYGIIRCPCSAR